MNNALKRLNTFCRYGEVLALIAMVVLVLIIAATAIMMAVVGLDADILSQIDDSAFTSGQLLAMGTIVIAAMIFALVILYYAYLLCKNIHLNNTPFRDENVKYLERISIFTVTCAIVVPIIGGIFVLAMDIDPTQMLTFNPLMLLFALPVYLASLVLKYGTTLQKESDETL
jgi:Mn2+/Fe2+ NRAMP family transporter